MEKNTILVVSTMKASGEKGEWFFKMEHLLMNKNNTCSFSPHNVLKCHLLGKSFHTIRL